MNSGENRRTRWTLTEDAFRQLLEFLDPVPSAAGERYERMRSRLITVFTWEHSAFPEDCADEAINRVAKALAAGTQIQSLDSFLHGVVRMILKETYRQDTKRNLALRQLHPASAAKPPDEEMECLEKCLASLPEESRRIIERYYEGERSTRIRNRKQLADELGIPMNALRNRTLRLRDKLEVCLQNCLLSSTGKME